MCRVRAAPVVEAAAALAPEHLSCYGLKVEEGTPLWAKKDSLSLPDDDAQADMYLFTVDYLAALRGLGQAVGLIFPEKGLQGLCLLQRMAGAAPGKSRPSRYRAGNTRVLAVMETTLGMFCS